MDHFYMYHQEIPAFLNDYLQIPAVRRLQNVGMNCGCEYTSFPMFRSIQCYSRYDHSIGVALIVWHFTLSRSQTIAGLLHDIATPVFAHVVDFLNGDYLKQESTEAGTRAIIEGSPELQKLLYRDGLEIEDVCDYHLYPVADNDAPRLSADRLEYSLGNIINFGFCTAETSKQFYDDLIVGLNEDNQEEIMFRTQQTAEEFAMAALKCSRVYVSDEDRYSMQILSEILQTAVSNKILTSDDLYTTEPEVIKKLRQNDLTSLLWDNFCSFRQITCGTLPDSAGKWRKIDAKKRYIDPMVTGHGRLSKLSPAFSVATESFLNTDFNYWICSSTD